MALVDQSEAVGRDVGVVLSAAWWAMREACMPDRLVEDCVRRLAEGIAIDPPGVTIDLDPDAGTDDGSIA